MDKAISDVNELRERARNHIQSGAVTEDYRADRAQVIRLLNEVLATELICNLRYKSHYYRACGIHEDAVKPEFLQHSREAEQHADMVARRIVQLNGSPDLNPAGLANRSRSEFIEGGNVVEMIREDLVAERIAVEFYSEIVHWLGDSDLVTRKVMMEILAMEAEHAEDMKNLLGRLQVVEG